MKLSAILLAAGEGRRLGKGVPKAFVQFCGKKLLLHSLELFERAKEIREVVLVVPKSKISTARKIVADCKKVKKIVVGGTTRQKSLAAGLKFAREKIVLVHNAANPFATEKEISRLVKELGKYAAAAVAHRADSTVRQNTKTLDRRKIWLMETPQLAKKEFLELGLKIANDRKIETTDELQLAELAGARIKIISADKRNRKITHPEDLSKVLPNPTFAKASVGRPPLQKGGTRIGLGHDSHRFSRKKKPLILGGVRISTSSGLEGNSDGDVILHALTNAISSALGGGSISTFADALCEQGIRDSRKYLDVVLKQMQGKEFAIENVAISIEGKRPKLEQHFPKIKKSLAQLLNIQVSQVGVTATSGEGLTGFGRGEGLQAFAIVLLKSL